MTSWGDLFSSDLIDHLLSIKKLLLNAFPTKNDEYIDGFGPSVGVRSLLFVLMESEHQSAQTSHPEGTVSLCNNWNYANSREATLCNNHIYSYHVFLLLVLSEARILFLSFLRYIHYNFFPCRPLMLLSVCWTRKQEGNKASASY